MLFKVSDSVRFNLKLLWYTLHVFSKNNFSSSFSSTHEESLKYFLRDDSRKNSDDVTWEDGFCSVSRFHNFENI
jgi:hypothetical protein